MFKFWNWILTLCMASAYGAKIHAGNNERVIGGVPAEIQDAPYQVAMLLLRGHGNYTIACGGSIVSPKVIVSVANFLLGYSPDRWKVRVGSSLNDEGGQVLAVSDIKVHEKYAYPSLDYNIALAKLSEAIVLDGVTAALIKLPAQDQGVADGTVALLTGWGATQEGSPGHRQLRKALVSTLNQKECLEIYGAQALTTRMLCAGTEDNSGGVGPCQSDIGGPLAVENVLIGVTSWIRGCGRPGYPGVWTRVASLSNWIGKELEGLE